MIQIILQERSQKKTLQSRQPIQRSITIQIVPSFQTGYMSNNLDYLLLRPSEASLLVYTPANDLYLFELFLHNNPSPKPFCLSYFEKCRIRQVKNLRSISKILINNKIYSIEKSVRKILPNIIHVNYLFPRAHVNETTNESMSKIRRQQTATCRRNLMAENSYGKFTNHYPLLSYTIC